MNVPAAQKKQRVLCLSGPTGTGKSAAALFLAQKLNGGVINADSRQIYRDFPIITAQPTATERAVSPHALYGFLDCADKLGAGAYAALAKERILHFAAQGRVPIIVGGTGLYLDALFSGIAEIPPVPRDISLRWRERHIREGSRALYTLLRVRDPACAARIHPNDSQRITRALEVEEATGVPLSIWQKRPAPPSGLSPLMIGIGMDMSLTELAPLLKKRIDAMFAAGAVAEAQAVFARCPDEHAPGWSGIGCAELFSYLAGRISLDECRALWLRNTRAYAKRQITWFKRNPAIRRLRSGALNEALEQWRDFSA